MSTIVNPFSALLMDARNPTDKPAPKNKTKKVVKKVNKEKPIEPVVQIPQPKDNKKTEKIQPSNQSVKIVVVDRTENVTQEKFSKDGKESRGDAQSRPAKSFKREPKTNINEKSENLNPVNGESGDHSRPKSDFNNIRSEGRGRYRNHDQNTRPTQKREGTNEVPPTQDNEELVEDLSADDRAARSRMTYRKMTVTRGRLLERHGDAKTRVKAVEKKSGHGLYNWGDQNPQEDSMIEGNTGVVANVGEVDGSKLNESENVVAEPEPVEYTLDEYKEMLKEKKIDPVFHQPTSSVKLAESKSFEKSESNIRDRQYEYKRPSEGREGGFPRGRGRFERGQRGFSRGTRGGEFRGRREEGSHEHKSQEARSANPRTKTVQELRIDDIADFPNL